MTRLPALYGRHVSSAWSWLRPIADLGAPRARQIQRGRPMRFLSDYHMTAHITEEIQLCSYEVL